MADKTVEQRQQQLSSFWDTGPGPAGVMLPPLVGMIDHDKTRHQNPAYSLGLKLGSANRLGVTGPGPAYLIPKGMTAKGPDPQLYATLKSRTKVNENFNINTPGPAAYLPDINLNRRRAPAYSHAFRTKLFAVGYASPGPIYLLPPAIGPKIPDKMAAAEITLKGRGKTVDKLSQSPGPIYAIGPPELIKNRAGEVTIKGRWRALKSQSVNAGPASYDLKSATNKVWRQPPSYSLGIRHTPFAGVLRTKCDNEDSRPSFDDC